MGVLAPAEDRGRSKVCMGFGQRKIGEHDGRLDDVAAWRDADGDRLLQDVLEVPADPVGQRFAAACSEAVLRTLLVCSPCAGLQNVV